MEEAPTPSSIIKEEKPIKELSLEISSSKKINYFLLFTCYQSYLNINLKTINNLPEKEFEEKFSLDKIKTISKYFLICESTIDVISSIEPNLKQSKTIEENNALKLIISLNHPLCKEAIFILPEKIKLFNQTELYYIISELKKDNQNQKKIIKNLENNVYNLTEKLKTLENKIEQLEKSNTENHDSMDSKIIKNDFEKEKAIKNWIDPFNKNIKFELLFRKSRDGSSCQTFHQYCDNKGPSLTLVETTKGYKFGGYNPFSFQSQIGYSPKNDNKTFIFSLNLMKKFFKKSEDSLVYFDPNFGPCFGKGGTDFYLEKNLDEGCTISKSFLTNSELTNGESGVFEVSELEIYQVI